MRIGTVVEWWCEVDGRACLLAEVSASTGDPAVQFRRQRMSQSVADMAREGDRSPGSLPTVALSDLHRRGTFGPVACKHYVFLSLSADELREPGGRLALRTNGTARTSPGGSVGR